MEELEFPMEIAASRAVWRYSGPMSAEKLQRLRYLVQMLMYKGRGARRLDGAYICGLSL